MTEQQIILLLVATVLGSGGVVAIVTTWMNNKHTRKLQKAQFDHAWHIEIIKRRIEAIEIISRFFAEIHIIGRRSDTDDQGMVFMNHPNTTRTILTKYLTEISPLNRWINNDCAIKIQKFNFLLDHALTAKRNGENWDWIRSKACKPLNHLLREIQLGLTQILKNVDDINELLAENPPELKDQDKEYHLADIFTR